MQTFHVEQSWNLTLYLALAYKNAESASNFHLLQPFRPEQLSEGDAVLSQILGDRRFGTIDRIYMVRKRCYGAGTDFANTQVQSPFSGVDTDIIYPDIYLTHRQLDQTSSWGNDITHIHVRANFRKWFATQELSTPENVSQILAIAPAVSPYGQGLYVLYVTQGITKIFARFLRPDPNATDGAMYTFVTNVKCPPGELPLHDGTCYRGRGC